MNVRTAADRLLVSIASTIAILFFFFTSELLASAPPLQDDAADAIHQFEHSFATGARFEGDPSTSIFQRMEYYDIPGVSIAVVEDFKLVWTKAYGVLDRESGRSITPDTVFPCEAISQPVVAAAALKLVEMGKLDLREDVKDYLRSRPIPRRSGKPITLRHLLGNTYPSEFPGNPFHETSDDIPADHVLDASKAAANASFCILREMILDVCPGKRFPQIMDELVLGTTQNVF